MNENERSLKILLIEDSPQRLDLVRQALKQGGISCRLHTVGTGTDALNYLKKEAPFTNAPDPDLVLFDYSQPQSRYLKLIDKIKTSEDFAGLPFAVLTRPESEEILEEKYAPSGKCVMFSPIELDAFLRIMHSVRRDRFMNAVALIGDLGLVLVRASDAFEQQQDTYQMTSYV